MTLAVASSPETAYLIFDTETVPDGMLLSRTRYPDLNPEEAITKAQAEARAASATASDFLPVTFQIPVAICVARVSGEFRLQCLRCLDAPRYRTREMVKAFWDGWRKYRPTKSEYRARPVTFNGRCFDLPLLELAAFRYGISLPKEHFAERYGPRYRYSNDHIDLQELLTNSGAIRLTGGLNLLAKLLGRPGKSEMVGDQVYGKYCDGELQAINEYCAFDVLDTYFVFLRTRVLVGELTLDQEQERVREAKDWITAQAADQPCLHRYLERWGDWQPWP